MRFTFLISLLPAIGASIAWAETDLATDNVPIAAPAYQEFCINVMSGFPNDDQIARYQFFKLTQELGVDSSPMLTSALDYFGDHTVTADTPVMEVIETIANPVLRQAAPELTIANMAFLIDFANVCDSYIAGQVTGLKALNPQLSEAEFNSVISEDALYMRQILSDSLFRINAQDHEIFGPTVRAYADALVTTRDRIEFTKFENDIESIEAIFMTDLDGRLARSNDVINQEMDRETLASSIEIIDEMNAEAKRKRKQEALYTLSRILGGY